jgi:hypothetical protein
MRHFLLIGLLITATFAVAQTKKDTGQVHATPGLRIDRIEERIDQLTKFADSLNCYNGGVLPTFLFDACIDWNTLYWEDSHKAISVRWLILQHVTNKRSLKLIIEKHDKRLNKKCNKTYNNEYPHLTVPMIRKSFCQLIRARYKQIE